MGKLDIKKRALFIACMLLSSTAAFAIESPIESNPGIINKQNTQQIKDLDFEKKLIDTVQSDLEKRQKKEEADNLNQKDEKKGTLTYNPHFKLNKIIFQGNTVYSDKELLKISENIIEKDIYLEDILNYTVKISRFYQKHGYLTSYAYLEPQEISDGTVVIKIKESIVEQKEVVGNRWERSSYLRNLALSGNGLNNGKVFNARDLQGAMKNLNNEAYLKSSVEITKNPKDDNTVIKLNVIDRFPLSLDVNWDDFGRNYSGRQRATTILGIDNLTGFGDKIYGGAIMSNGTKGALAGYQIPLGHYGTKLAFDYSYSNMSLGGPYKPLDIKGKATDYSIKVIQPIKNTADTEITASIGVDALNSKTDVLSLDQNISNYRLRILKSEIYGKHDDKNGRTIGNLGVDLGTTGLGASDNIAGGPQSSYWKLVAGTQRVQRLQKKCLGIVRINGQYSPKSLYSSEQMYLGGIYSIRGYQPGEIVGDYGVAGSVELRTPVPLLAQMLPEKISSWADKIKLAAFYDWGYVKEHNNMYGYPDNFLQSVGVGTYINITDAISLQMGVGVPLGKKYYNDDNARFYFSINSELDRLFMKPKARSKKTL